MTLYPLVLDDGGRNLSRRISSYNDCTVRSFAIISGLSFDDVYDELARAGRKSCQGFDSAAYIRKKRGKLFGGTFRRVPVRGLTPATFAARYPNGRYMLEVPVHVWVVINGWHHDLWRVKEQPLSGAWVYIKDQPAH